MEIQRQIDYWLGKPETTWRRPTRCWTAARSVRRFSCAFIAGEDAQGTCHQDKQAMFHRERTICCDWSTLLA